MPSERLFRRHSSSNHFHIMHIRSATLADLPAIIAIDEQTNTSAWSATLWQTTLQSPYNNIHIALKNNQIIGLIVWESIADTIELHLIATALSYQKQGVAQQLMQQMFDCANEEITHFMLEVRSSNHAAQSLYRKLSFQQIAVRKQYYRDGEDAIIMEKII